MAHATARGAYAALAERLNRFPQGAPPTRAPVPHPRDAVQRARGGPGRAAADPAVHRPASGPDLGPARGGGTIGPRRPRVAGRPAGHGGSQRDALHAAAAHGRLLRVLDDAGQGRHRPAAAGRALLPVHHRGGRLRPRAVHERRDPARARVRQRAGPARTPGRRPAPTATAPSTSSTTSGPARSSRPPQHMAVGVCYCRHKAEHVGRACAAPKNICMTFGGTADSLIRHGYARRVDAAEGIDLLARGLREQRWSSSARTCSARSGSSATAAAAAARR